MHATRSGDLPHWRTERGAIFCRTVAMHLREELFSLQLRVEADNGWESRDIILGGGPFASDDKVYCIDVSDIPGERLRIKLTPPPHYWMINYVGVDYSENTPVTVTELKPSTAYDRDGLDMTNLLTKKDDHYHVMEPSDPAVNVAFDVPPNESNMDRSFILKATGYYDIHVSPEGGPSEQLLERLAAEPGFAARYASRQIEKWHEAALRRLALR
jgi:hypothetical protein